MTPAELRENLESLSDADYREFHLRTCPGAEHVLGVRLRSSANSQKPLSKVATIGIFSSKFNHTITKKF